MILALDPGPQETGYVVYRPESGRIFQAGVADNEDLIDRLVTFGCVDLAIEMIASYGMPVGREVFETCVWIGRFQQAWLSRGRVRRVLRRDVKLHLCNSVKAKDANVWQALKDRFGDVGTKKNPGALYLVKSHARAALAVAVTAADLDLFGTVAS